METIKVLGVTCLSKEEYETYKDLITSKDWWWLKTPAGVLPYTKEDGTVIQYPAAYIVYDDGTIKVEEVGRGDISVRYALILENTTAKPGSKIYYGKYLDDPILYIVLNSNLAILWGYDIDSWWCADDLPNFDATKENIVQLYQNWEISKLKRICEKEFANTGTEAYYYTDEEKANFRYK